MLRTTWMGLCLMAGGGGWLHAQATRTMSDNLRRFVTVSTPVVALTHVRLVDGTGDPARDDQTVVILGERISSVGPTGAVAIPDGAQVVDLSGHTVIPGLVGLHDHMYYSSVGGSMKLMPASYPALFLGNGVTTIRTTGSVDSYMELNLKQRIDAGEMPGPDVHVTGPYLQGPGGGIGAMHPVSGPDDARRMVRYWAEEGVTWFKAYTQISRAELAAAIDEAHQHGVKVTAHLCSVGFREAAALGIDNLEHGLLVNTEYYDEKQPDQCPTVGSSTIYGDLDIESPEVQQTIREMVDRGVGMTSTLAVMELSSPSRIPIDERVLDALYPDARAAVLAWFEREQARDDSANRALLRKAMDFERSFVRSGGILAAGSDPCCLSVIAGYGDQRNYELLIEAGFTVTEAVRIMTHNGATILDIDDRVGTVERGKQADLVVLEGDLTADPSVIRNVVTVFRQGLGFDSERLIAVAKGRVGLQ